MSLTEQEALLALLERIEDRAERAGWDRPPRLILINDQLTAWHFKGVTLDMMELLGAGVVTAVPTGPGYQPLARPIVAVAFLSEAWTRVHQSVADMKAFAATYAYGDVTASPDRVEIRVAYGLDRAGNQYQVERARGGQPRSEIVAAQVQADAERVIGLGTRGPGALRRVLAGLPAPGSA